MENDKKLERLIAVIDIETTHFRSNYGVIVEVGACKLDTMTGSIEKLFSSRVNDKFDREKESDAWIFHNSTLTPQMIVDAPSLESKRSVLQEIFNKYPVTAYNKDFDIGWLKSRRFEFPRVYPDPMLIAKGILKIPHPHYVIKLPSVQECINYFKLGGIEEHRGYSDCVYEAKIIYELIKMKAYNL